MRPGEYLGKDQSFTSSNGIYRATLQNDGNFVLYRKGPSRLVLWDTRTVSSAITRLCFGLPSKIDLI